MSESGLSDKGRRGFLLKAGLASAGALLPWETWAKKSDELLEVVILHTNDWHSRIDPFPESHPQYGGKGGAARRAALISQIRSKHPHVLVFDSGDIVQGTPYFNFYHGEPEYQLMNDMGYNAVTLGNHDFDNGIDGLVKLCAKAKFETLVCNYDVEETALSKYIKSYSVFQLGKIRIGVTGLGIDLKGLVPTPNYQGLVYKDPLTSLASVAKHLKNDLKCHTVICLSHLGLEYKNNKISDKILASESNNIDFILGGHTHSFVDSALEIQSPKGHIVRVSQMGWAGLRLGFLKLLYRRIDKGSEPVFAIVDVFEKSIAI